MQTTIRKKQSHVSLLQAFDTVECECKLPFNKTNSKKKKRGGSGVLPACGLLFFLCALLVPTLSFGFLSTAHPWINQLLGPALPCIYRGLARLHRLLRFHLPRGARPAFFVPLSFVFTHCREVHACETSYIWASFPPSLFCFHLETQSIHAPRELNTNLHHPPLTSPFTDGMMGQRPRTG